MRLWRCLVTSLGLVAIAACSEEATPTMLDPAGLEALASLGLVVPTVTPELLMFSDSSAGPARSNWQEPPPPEPEPMPDPYAPVSDIWNQRSGAAFVDNYLSAWGDHYYQGNKGRVVTTGTVLFEGKVVGTQPGETEETFPFILDLGRVHYILATARVYTDRTCGLTGYSSSIHQALWQAVAAGPVFQFNETVRSSQSSYVYQPACAPVTPPTGGGGGGDDPYDGRTICYYYIEYDLQTGYIYRNEILFCTTGG